MLVTNGALKPTWVGPTDLATYHIHGTKCTVWNSLPKRDILTDVVTHQNTWSLMNSIVEISSGGNKLNKI